MFNIDITQEEFEKIQKFVKNRVGISLSDQKATMVKGRLHKRLKELNMSSFSEYYRYLNSPDGEEEMVGFISAISTNVTSFFRSPKHWEYLKDNINDMFAKKTNKKIRIWSAACSSGEEPYSIAMFLKDNLRNFDSYDIKILATDISHKVLSKAIVGVYDQKDVDGMPKILIQKHFITHKSARGAAYEVDPELKSKIVFRTFNLINDDFSIFKFHFDAIFCRNVMIYFDSPTRKALISRFGKLLDRSGILIIGDSEAITENKSEFSLIKSSIYKKV
ncbi:MAG TPA: protein-glutamate O-methyltransferase CheR, partial [Campylobacterales bacterium]|nr:protein-glutamate O-methyltransferase CheR [Campylobacterales bacterium]